MSIPYANREDKNNGWRLSPLFLKEVQESLEEYLAGDGAPSLAQIEDVILTYEKLK